MVAPMVFKAKKRRLCDDSQPKVLQKYATKIKNTPMVPIQSLPVMRFLFYERTASVSSALNGETAGSK